MAEPSQPVVLIGFEQAPQIGEKFKVYSDIISAQKYIEKKEKKTEKREVIVSDSRKKILNLILKADVSGTLEAIEGVLKNLPQEKVILRILKKEVGDINENDVKLAESSKAKILGFRVKVSPIALEIKDLGKIKVLLIFRTEKNKQIVGGKVMQGLVNKGNKIEIMREDASIGKGRIIELQKNKKNINKAEKGQEIGILCKGDANIEQGDILVPYTEEEVKEEL